MKKSGEVENVNISHSNYTFLKDHPELKIEPRGKFKAKYKGEIPMYFVESADRI